MNPTPCAFLDHCLELLAPLGAARARLMFGGYGLYVDDLFVAIIVAERLYLKVDEVTRAHFEGKGCRPFVYDAKGRAISLGYFNAPQDAMDSPALMLRWARLALEAALRARSARRTSTVPSPKRRARCSASSVPATRLRQRGG